MVQPVHYIANFQATIPLCGVWGEGVTDACTVNPVMVTCTICKRRLPQSRMPEKLLLAQVRELAKRAGWRTYHTRDSRGSEPGFPDLVLLKPPILRFAELKRDGEHPTIQQAVWLSNLRGVKEVYADLWRPADLGAIVKVFGF